VAVLRESKALPGEAPGTVTRYSTLTTKVLTDVIEGATGLSFTEVFGDRVWSKIGARQDFMVGLGSDGVASAYGLNYTMLEDLARYALIFTSSCTVVSDSEVVSPEVLKAMQSSGSHDAFMKGDWPQSAWVKASFVKGMPTASSRPWDIVWDDGAMFKHGNLFQGIYVDPKREVVGVYYSTSPISGDPDILPGYIRQAAKNLAGARAESARAGH